jgi:XTP/dITP diphosphohydrolase
MPKLIIASQNKDKLKEIKTILSDLKVEILSAWDIVPGFDVAEDRDTILGNAAKKALETAKATGLPSLADDTGLFIYALNGEPGVYAARFAGKDCTYADNRNKALSTMKNVTDRRAEFRTVVILAEQEGIIAYCEGIVYGWITEKERGRNGFGYDAIFEVEGTGKTYAEMNDSEKNACSHRGKALKEIIPLINEYFENIELLRG